MTMFKPDLSHVHSSWLPCLKDALAKVDPAYLNSLCDTNWVPGADKIFNAFSIPVEKVNYVLFGESPYPRSISANGYAFWDDAVTDLWSTSGLSKQVNRATSLRNIIKMLLIADGLLDKNNPSQENIAKICKEKLIQTNEAFFTNFLNHGFLLLNATPVLKETGAPHKDAKAWLGFMQTILTFLLAQRPQTKFILFGRIANTIDGLIPANHIDKFYAEHPYNLSFIHNQKVIDFFKPLNLLKK